MTHRLSVSTFGVFAILALTPCNAQTESDGATIRSAVGSDGTGTITVEARGHLPEPPVFYKAIAKADARVTADRIEQDVQLEVQVIQGKAKTLSFGLEGDGEVTDVKGKNLKSWSVRRVNSQRFLDLHLSRDSTKLSAVIRLRSADIALPKTIDLMNLTAGDSVGFDSSVGIQFAAGVDGVVTVARGFMSLENSDAKQSDATVRFQSTSGGQITLALGRDGALPGPVEFTDTTLEGDVNPDGKSIRFQLKGTANVSEAGAEIIVLSGNAALSEVPNNDNYRLRLATVNDQPVYKLVFAKTGTFPVEIQFVASPTTTDAGETRLDFTIGASAIVPLSIRGLDADLAFHPQQDFVTPLRRDEQWVSFLPATGRTMLQWKTTRKAGEGKLFFTTTGLVEARMGTGLLRQDHQIDYQVLQGELKSLSLQMRGPGEVLDVQGSNLVAWKVTGTGEDRVLDVTLSQPITTTSQVKVRSQTALGAFPVRVDGLRLAPIGTIRHSGYLRLTNLGLVRLEPTGLSGLTQLAPQQFPGEAIDARQIFVYRFPAAEHAFTVAADRIQPEVNVSQVVLYELAETDRAIKAEIELDIREAPIREWDLRIPSDYSVVSVTGASVADYVAATDMADERRNLKIIFNQDAAGRQLVSLHLEKSEVAVKSDWVLPRIEYPEAKTVRGDIGIIGAPGFRLAIAESELLVEKPLSYFPKPSSDLQQAFRIREPEWSATMHIELLERSVQSDVFHLYSLSEETVYGSALINYFVTGSPVSQWTIDVPASLGNVIVDGQDVRTWRRDGDTLIVSLHQPVLGAYTLLVSFEEKPDAASGTFRAGLIVPREVQGERGYIQVVSPMQVETNTVSISQDMLKLDPLELPAEFRLLSTAPPLGTWQYTERPFELNLKVNWFEPGSTVTQVVEFAEANTRVSTDGELVTDVIYYVKSRGQRTLKIKLPAEPVRLWEVSVNGQPITARQADDITLVPLPGGVDPNVPIEVRLRLGKPSVNELKPDLMLPIVFAPVLKTQWNVTGDEKHVLVPRGGTVSPPVPVLRPPGFYWVAKQGLIALFGIGLLVGFGLWSRSRTMFLRVAGFASLVLATLLAESTAYRSWTHSAAPSPLEISVPILSAGQSIELAVTSTPLWLVNLSWTGLIVGLCGAAMVVWSLTQDSRWRVLLVRWGGVLLMALGLLLQGDGAPLFFALLAIAILVLFLVPMAWTWIRNMPDWYRGLGQQSQTTSESEGSIPSSEFGSITSSIVMFAMLVFSTGSCLAKDAVDFEPADSIKQEWQVSHADARLVATGTITFSGVPGSRVLLLRAPAVLTRFDGQSVRLAKTDVPGEGLCYVLTIPISDEPDVAAKQYDASFEYQLEPLKPTEGMTVLTGVAAVQEIDLSYDEAGWDVFSPTAVRIETVDAAGKTQAKVLLGPERASLFLKPKARDVATEEKKFFIEASNLYLPGPGVVDGRHHLHIRMAQGQMRELSVMVPTGLTVSSVSGPVGSWQFDADSGRLKLQIEPSQSQAFDVTIETQRGLDPLPTDITLAPIRVEGAVGEVGQVGIAFGPDAQPEKMDARGMSAVNLGDFDASLMQTSEAVLHRVYRYGADEAQLVARIAPVQPEVRVLSEQILSLGDERVVLGINFAAEITRAGLFQLSFPLPGGLEVESLSGPALHHWAELSEGGQRQIVLHLNGKTIGTQSFAITLSGNAPTDVADWEIPRFELNEATRQTGELVVKPTTGIRLRTVTRSNVSETDPRTMGGDAQGSLAFRLLQRDWNLVLGIEKLDPWITGQLLHEVTLREGQTRSMLVGHFDVQNASIRSLQVTLPIVDQDEIKTLRAHGDTVSDFVRTAPDSDVWEVQFKRRMIGKFHFRIEYERRGDRENDTELLRPAGFPEARQLTYYFAVRAGGRLELEYDTLNSGLQRVDWSTVPATLRDAENRTAPAFALRAVAPTSPLSVRAKRHSLADALKLRVTEGTLTTVLSPQGDQLTSVDVTIEVIQRSSLSVGLPEGGDLFSIFVNGESVNSIRQGKNLNAWQFYILPGIDDRTAKVRFVYSVPGERLSRLKLTSPELNVPLENIQWNIVAPKGFELIDSDGNLELVSQSNQQQYDRNSYLSKISGKRAAQAQQAAQLLEQANVYLQAGEQTKAGWAFNSVANQYALDAASNEDARVQLENLQTQQAIVGLNTRRQRLYLDNNRADSAAMDNQQLREAAADNPVLQQDQLNFRPQQISQLLRGNTTEDNAVLQQIAGRLVQHQHTTDPAPQAIIISLPEEGLVYTFSRSVQVAQNEALELDLTFGSQRRLHLWQSFSLLVLLTAFAAVFASARKFRPW